MTDRQTMRSGCWSITTFNENEIKYLEGDSFPPLIKEVYGGKEMCPQTGRVHFQGCLITTWCRFSAIKKIFDKAHIEKAYQKEALIKYAMKSETAIGDKKKVENKHKYYNLEDVMKLIAKTFSTIPIEEKIKYEYSGGAHVYTSKSGTVVEGHEENYWLAVRAILYERPFLASILSQPQTLRLWKNTYQVWMENSV